MQSVADPSFGAGVDRHGRCGDRGEPDSDVPVDRDRAVRSGALRQEAQPLGHDALIRVLLDEVAGVLQARDLRGRGKVRSHRLLSILGMSVTSRRHSSALIGGVQELTES
jgi:hypothetical protein